MIGRILDRVILEVAPGWAQQRVTSRLRHLFAARMLSIYAGADKGRKNKDWRASNASADAAIIPDTQTLNGRARQLARDSWVGKSAVRSARRNVVGRGIIPVPCAKDAGGKELKALNDGAESLFWRWASNKNFCDVERRQTFWRKQRLCVSERMTVGQHFVVWNYVPNAEAVGLRLQSFEPEQLDQTLLNYDPTGNEVRGGIEVDRETGAAVAYHFYVRNPNDYGAAFPQMMRGRFISRRYPADRVWHYFDQERVLQCQGVTDFTPVLQRIRDFHRRDEAEMWAAIMEACIGLVIEQSAPTGPGFGPTFRPAAGDPGLTDGGLPTADFVPGMVFRAMPGEKIAPFAPTRPGGNFQPHAVMNLRGIAAALGMGYEQISRDFSLGTYSSQRQGMLEDNKEFQVDQDDLIDTFIAPCFELWYAMAVAEGRFLEYGLSMEQFVAEPHRYTEAEYIPPPMPWIDPEKEVNAKKEAIRQRLKTRKAIIAEDGGRLRRTFEQIGAEKELAAEMKLTLPEDVEAAAAIAKATQPQPSGGSEKSGGTNPPALTAMTEEKQRLEARLAKKEARLAKLTAAINSIDDD
jgi:lambda family phage portal protein